MEYCRLVGGGDPILRADRAPGAATRGYTPPAMAAVDAGGKGKNESEPRRAARVFASALRADADRVRRGWYGHACTVARPRREHEWRLDSVLEHAPGERRRLAFFGCWRALGHRCASARVGIGEIRRCCNNRASGGAANLARIRATRLAGSPAAESSMTASMISWTWRASRALVQKHGAVSRLEERLGPAGRRQ